MFTSSDERNLNLSDSYNSFNSHNSTCTTLTRLDRSNLNKQYNTSRKNSYGYNSPLTQKLQTKGSNSQPQTNVNQNTLNQNAQNIKTQNRETHHSTANAKPQNQKSEFSNQSSKRVSLTSTNPILSYQNKSTPSELSSAIISKTLTNSDRKQFSEQYQRIQTFQNLSAQLQILPKNLAMLFERELATELPISPSHTPVTPVNCLATDSSSSGENTDYNFSNKQNLKLPVANRERCHSGLSVASQNSENRIDIGNFLKYLLKDCGFSTDHLEYKSKSSKCFSDVIKIFTDDEIIDNNQDTIMEIEKGEYREPRARSTCVEMTHVYYNQKVIYCPVSNLTTAKDLLRYVQKVEQLNYGTVWWRVCLTSLNCLK